MVEDLNMTGIQYNIALSIFFIPYILLEGSYDIPACCDSVKI